MSVRRETDRHWNSEEGRLVKGNAVSWWRQDRSWARSTGVAGLSTVAGALIVALGHGLGAVLGAEAAFGTAAGFTVAAGLGVRRAWLGRADDYAPSVAEGVTTVLSPTGTWASGPIATVTRESGATEIAILRRDTVPALGLALDEGDTESGVMSVTARAAGKVLRLQHRQGLPEDVETLADRTDLQTQTTPVVPELMVQWVDEHGAPRAGAHRVHEADGEHWTITGARIVLRFTVPDHPSRRPARRVLRAASSERVYLLEHRRGRRMPEVRFIAPPELEDLEVLLCVWLAHLLDAHAATGEHWPAPSAEWTVVADDFPSRIGPGGFGRGYDEYNGHVNVAYTGG